MSNLNNGGLTRVLNYIKAWVNGLLSGKSDTSHTHTKSQITDFPSLSTVATSGSYNDLSNKPSIPSIDLRPQASADANTVSDGVAITHYGSNGPSTSLGATVNDGALFQQCWSSVWKAQIAADYRNGNLFTRGKNFGTWQPWRAVAYHGDNVSKFTNDSGYVTSSINPTSGNYSEGIRFNKSTNGWATITIGTASGTTYGAMNGTGWGIFCDTSDNFIINNFDSSTGNAALYCSDTNTYISNLHISGGYKIYVG